MSKTKKKSLPLNCHQYTQLMIELTKSKKKPTRSEQRRMNEHQDLCTKHNFDTGMSRFVTSLKRGDAPLDPSEIEILPPSKAKSEHNFGVIEDCLRPKRRTP